VGRGDYMDVVVEAINNLTLQVSRLAWAAEVDVISSIPVQTPSLFLGRPCHRCGSQLIHRSAAECHACLEPVKEPAKEKPAKEETAKEETDG